MIEYLLAQLLALAALTTLGILLIVFNWKEYRLRKKVELLTHIIDKGYEHDNVDINQL